MRRAVLLAAVGLLGCAEEVNPACMHEPVLTYENFGEGFVEQFCAGCHSSNNPPHHRNGAPVGVDFDYYEGVLVWYERIAIRTDLEEGPTMPPGFGPTDHQYAMFNEWLQCEVWDDWIAYQTELYYQ